MNKKPRLIFLVTEDWYFCLHRLPIALAATKAGYEVLIATQVNELNSPIRQYGFEIIPMQWQRNSMNPVNALSEIKQIRNIIKKHKPDILHLVAMKPSLYGCIAAFFNLKVALVPNLAGLGQAYISNNMFAKILRLLLGKSFQLLFARQRSVVIVENSDDRAYLSKTLGINTSNVKLIRGVGVNIDHFHYVPEPRSEKIRVCMVSRMLWPKGVMELVDAARKLKSENYNISVQLVGMPDKASSITVTEDELSSFQKEGVLEWLGFLEDIPELWADSHIAILPTYYREGIPRSLLEAAACGRAIIATDMPGCREIVDHGVNGLLIEPKNVNAIVDAIKVLIDNPGMREEMGKAGRRMVEQCFTEELVISETLEVYRSMVSPV